MYKKIVPVLSQHLKTSVKRTQIIFNTTILIVLSQCLILSCTIRQESTNQKPNSTGSLIDGTETPSEITTEQEAAFAALNKLQVQIQGQHIYSTFPDIHHDCFPTDTSFVISSTKLLAAMEELLAGLETDLTIEEFNKLTATAVLAQETYLVKQSYGSSMQLIDGVLKKVRTTSMKSGTWVLPMVLGRRDVLLEW